MSVVYDIALASFNGEKYLRKQLESLIDAIEYCSLGSIRSLIISDDNSLDDTLGIVEEFSKEYPFIKIMINKRGKGVKNNFDNALSECTSDYVFLCDQDDFWHKDKIERSLSEMLKVSSNTLPVLVFTNVNLVDDKLNLLSVGLGISKEDASDSRCTAFRSFGQGCTMLLNRSLLDLSGTIPNACVMHDWWFLLLASNFGFVKFIEEPLIDYRQHTGNVCAGYKSTSYKRFFNLKKQKEYFDKLEKQSTFFLFFCEKYNLDLDSEVKSLHKMFSEIRKKPVLLRIFFLLNAKIYNRGLKEKIKLFIQVIA